MYQKHYLCPVMPEYARMTSFKKHDFQGIIEGSYDAKHTPDHPMLNITSHSA